jgi:hypothetical protein
MGSVPWLSVQRTGAGGTAGSPPLGRARAIPQHALDAARGIGGAVADDHHAGVLGAADADAAAVVDRHPGGAEGAVQQRVQQRPAGRPLVIDGRHVHGERIRARYAAVVNRLLRGP